jgi:hypothetical protein
VATLGVEMLDVAGERLVHPEPVEGEQQYQGMRAWAVGPGGGEELAELVAVQAGGLGVLGHLGALDRGEWRLVESANVYGVRVEPGQSGELTRMVDLAAGLPVWGRGWSSLSMDRGLRAAVRNAPGTDLLRVKHRCVNDA